MTWLNRLRYRKKLENQLDKELAFHLEQHTAELIAQGHDPAKARRLARLDLGGPEQVREECRDARGTRCVEDLAQDVRFAIRTLRQRPGFSAVALLSLALGTGATTVMFSLVDGVMLKPLAYRDPGRLLRLQEKTDYRTPQGDLWSFTYPNYLDCKHDVQSADMGAWSFYRGTLSKPGAPEYLDGAWVSADLFPILGVTPAFGRGFFPEEDKPGAEPVTIISHSLWQRHFGGSRDVLDSKLVYDGKSYIIIGVMPSTFRIEDVAFDVFVPVGQDPSPGSQNRRRHGYGVYARLHFGATLVQTQSELAVVGPRLAAQYPDTNKGRSFIADPLKPDIGDTQSTLWLLLGAVTLVLLIACANIASLLLARAVSRERELAMRAALGASRGRLIRQCLTESAVLALAGGVLGVALAAIGIHPFTLFWPGGLPRVQDVQLNWQVLLFALGISLLSGLLFGLAPALRTAARHLEDTLRAASRSLAGGTRRLHGAFVVSEIAIAVVLLVSAGLLGRTMLRLSALDPGVNLHNVVTARTALSPATLTNPDATRAAWQYLMDKVRAVPGVQAVATVDTVPMRKGSNTINYSLTPNSLDNYSSDLPVVLPNSVSADYLKVTGIPLRRGRFLTAADRKGTQPVAVIDDVLAQQSFHGQDPIGKPIWIGLGTDPLTIVGVVGHVRQWGLAADDQSNVRAQLYYPFAQVPDRFVRRWSELMSVAVKTNVDPSNILEPLHRAVRGVTGDQVIYDINTFEDLAIASLARQRFLLLLFGVFAMLALLLACIGIYGVLAYLGSQRVPEIGVRMALGATGSRVLWMVLRQSLVMIFAGIAVGSGGGWLATRYLTQSVEGARASEPTTFGPMIALLVTTALIASFIPARRASLVDPVRALRQE
jgi:predicted permease